MSESRTSDPGMWSSRLRVFPIAVGIFLIAGCASENGGQPKPGKGQGPSKPGDFLVVDCLLPSQIRQLGTQMTYLSARQAIKTSARDCEIRGGEYVSYDRANYATALKVWLPLAEQGDAPAQTNVGEIFEKGLGVPPDYAAAAEWYRRAAERGYSRAAISLGNLFENGLGVPKDSTQALNWYRRAAGLPELTFEVLPGRTGVELQQLRAQIAEMRSQLQTKQAELDRAQAELDAERRSIEDMRRTVEAERLSLVQLRKEIQNQKDKGQVTAGKLDELQKSVAEREGRLDVKDREVAALRTSLARAEADSRAPRNTLAREAAALRERLAGAEAESSAQRAGIEGLTQQAATGGPKISLVQVQLLDPEVALTTRDAQVRPTPASAATSSVMKVLLVGRVTTEIGLKSITVNQRNETLDSEHLFRAQIPLTETDRRVRILAVDLNGRSSTLNFVLPAVAMIQRAGTIRGREGSTAEGKPDARRPKLNFGSYHALVIGNNSYGQLPALRTAVDDATDVAKILTDQYQFKTTVLTNASRYQILSALNDLREKLTSKDNLLIYYAGYGILDETNQRGYWLPVDAESKDTTNWIANGDITAILNTMAVRQLLVVSDSCYAGTLSRSVSGQVESGMSDEELLNVIQKMAQRRSRLVMTSGGLEPVLDSAGGKHSAFADIFIQVLRENDGILLGREAFRRLQVKVASMAERLAVPQVPEYAPIQFAGHEAGDFVFIRPGG